MMKDWSKLKEALMSKDDWTIEDIAALEKLRDSLQELKDKLVLLKDLVEENENVWKF